MCDDAFGVPDANVACRQLGFSGTGANNESAHVYTMLSVEHFSFPVQELQYGVALDLAGELGRLC